MFVDAFTQVAAAQAFSATGVSDSSIDMTAVDPDWGKGTPVGFMINIDVAMDVGDADETYVFEIVDDDDAALGSPVVISTMPVLRGEGTLGKKFFLPLPPNRTKQRYLGLQLTLGGTTPSVTISSHLCPQSMKDDEYRNYASGFTIS